ncbi:hypothetical protein vBValMR11Z_244 [Vibrio phage vB_ValM_R11Z]|nr:hypothetical protein vBValMR11Z_244 [Vibrio phage vB_ValM_R11Z]URQ03517.1 hypothetical protein PVA23_140 [Vibrio phage PVA23]
MRWYQFESVIPSQIPKSVFSKQFTNILIGKKCLGFDSLSVLVSLVWTTLVITLSNALIAQLAVQLTCNEQVRGSNPCQGTIFKQLRE